MAINAAASPRLVVTPLQRQTKCSRTLPDADQHGPTAANPVARRAKKRPALAGAGRNYAQRSNRIHL